VRARSQHVWGRCPVTSHLTTLDMVMIAIPAVIIVIGVLIAASVEIWEGR